MNFRTRKRVLYDGDDYIKYIKDNFIETICKLKKTNNVYLVSPIPEMQVSVPSYVAREIRRGKILKHYSKIKLADYYKVNELVFKFYKTAVEQCGAKIISTEDSLCDSKYCYGDKNNIPLFVDYDHMSESGNKLLTPSFINSLNI